jgi:hypothetical protein
MDDLFEIAEDSADMLQPFATTAIFCAVDRILNRAAADRNRRSQDAPRASGVGL